MEDHDYSSPNWLAYQAVNKYCLKEIDITYNM